MTSNAQIQRNKDTVLRFLERTHSNRLDGFEEMVTEDVVLHGFPGGDPRDREQYKEFFVGLNAAFPDMVSDILAIVADADRVAAHWRVRGTHSAPYAGVPASGRAVDFTGMVIYRMVDGRIAEVWLQPDLVTLLQQLGALPEAAAA